MSEAYSGILAEFMRQAHERAQSPALVFKRQEKFVELSYERLSAYVEHLRRRLASLSIRPQDKVAIALGNQPEWPVAFFATLGIGAVVVPLDTRLSPQEILQLLAHSESKLLITNSKYSNRINDAGQFPCPVIFTDIDEFEKGVAPGCACPCGAPEVSAADDPAALFYTSGTTGVPKGVVLSHHNLLANVGSVRGLNVVKPDDVFISLLPLHHTYSFMVTCLVPLLAGARVSYPASINSEDLLDCLKSTRVTLLPAVPQVFSLLHKAIAQRLKAQPLSRRLLLKAAGGLCWALRRGVSLNLCKFLFAPLHRGFGGRIRYLISGGARLDDKVLRDFYRWGFTLLEGYGLTETSPIAAFNAPGKTRFGSVGKAVPAVEIAIMNPDGTGSGEIAIKGPNVMSGYFKMPEETARVIKDGWFYTKDAGYIDKDGFVFVTGRKDELIVLSSGKKIIPEEIENHYSRSPFIKELCVFLSKKQGGQEGGEQLMALVVAAEDHFKQRGIVNIEERLRWELDNLSQELSSYKRIKGFLVSKEKLPRTALGKIMRHKVIESAGTLSASFKSEGPVVQDEQEKLLCLPGCRKTLEYLSTRLKKEVHLGDYIELDLGLDSLGRIELLLELQGLFHVEIPESLVMELFYVSTVKDLIVKVLPYLPKELHEPQGEEFSWTQFLARIPSAENLAMLRLKPTRRDSFLTLGFLALIGIFLKIFFFFGIRERKNLPKKGPYIIFANHTSYLDPLLIAASLPFSAVMNSYFVGFKQIFDNAILRKTIKTARFIPVDITLEAAETLQLCAYLLRNGKNIFLFPEGQRSAYGRLIKFKKGVGILAKELDIPLVPVYIKGAFRAWSRHRTLPRPAKVTLTFGKQVSYTELKEKGVVSGNSYEEVASALQQMLAGYEEKDPDTAHSAAP